MNTSGSTNTVVKRLTAEDFDNLDMACRREDINGMQAIALIRRHYEALAQQPDEPAGDVVTAMLDYNQMLRSFAMIASRNGEQMRWKGLYDQIHALLAKHHETWKRYFPPMQDDEQPETEAAPSVETSKRLHFLEARMGTIANIAEGQLTAAAQTAIARLAREAISGRQPETKAAVAESQGENGK